MSVVGINFGSATSGSGFDVDSTVSAIMTNMRAPETAWNARTKVLQAQDTALTTLGTDLSALSTALSSLTSFDGVLSSKTGATSDATVVSLTSADNTARAGTHSITVSQLAQTSSEYSSLIQYSDTLSGSLTLQVGNGATTTIQLDSSNNTLATLAAAINQADLGITANVVTDKNGSRLSLISETSGSDGQITVGGSISDETTGSSLSFMTGQPGLDAEFTVDGLSMTSSSNTVNGAIPGVTFQILSTSTTPVQAEIVNDTSSVATSLNSFVTAYNQLVSDMTTQEGKDSTGSAEPLFGSVVLSTIQTQLASALGTPSTGSGSLQYLSQLGISMGTDGKLSIDSSTLTAQLSSNFSSIQKFFQMSGNFGQSLLTTLNNLGKDSAYGTVNMALSENATEEATLAENVSNLEDRLSAYQISLTNQLTQANQILQAIPQRLDEIKQIYDAITGYNSKS